MKTQCLVDFHEQVSIYQTVNSEDLKIVFKNIIFEKFQNGISTVIKILMILVELDEQISLHEGVNEMDLKIALKEKISQTLNQGN